MTDFLYFIKTIYSSNLIKFTIYASNALNIYNVGSAIYNIKKDYYKFNTRNKFHLFVCSIVLFLFYGLKSLIPFFNLYSSSYEYFHRTIEKIILKTFTSYGLLYKSVIPTIEQDKEAVDDAIKNREEATEKIEKLNDVLKNDKDAQVQVYFTEEELSKLTPKELKEKIKKELGVDKIEFYNEEEFINSIDDYLERNGGRKTIGSVVRKVKKRIKNIGKKRS